jgi:regulator of sirC expression with transglutaminase-like and TPR domain
MTAAGVLHIGLVEEAAIELDLAALEIAALDHPDTDPSPYLNLLEQMTERLRAEAPASPTPKEQAAVLAGVLAGEFGFEGDRETYDDPANADMFSVIDRRRGLPIALAILYVALARRLEWTAHVLGLPGHVLAGIGRHPMVVIDPFNAGVIIPTQPAAMAPLMPNRAVLARLLMNQASRAEQAQQLGRALVVLERITTVAPEYSEAWWERARLELAAGNTAAAREHLSSMLETTRDPDLRRRAHRALESLAG